jgi:L-ascorbate metabolism protein UlaG (beta-lactamase superfamily)
MGIISFRGIPNSFCAIYNAYPEGVKSMKARIWILSLPFLVLLSLILAVAQSNHPEQFGKSTAIVRKRSIVHELGLPSRLTSPHLQEGSIFFVGNATVIIRYAGFTILTDPNFLHKGDHVHLGYGLQTTRLTNPAIELEQLPPIDLILLSHMHEDHFDQLVQKKLNHSIPVVTTVQAAQDLKKIGFKTTYGLNKWERVRVRKEAATLEITAMPGKHGPGLMNEILPEMNGNMLEFFRPDAARPYRLYISGDTLINDELKEIPKQYPNIDLALLHLGGTRVLGIMVTMDAKQGLRALQIIAPQMAIPIHFNDYDRFKSPLSDFKKAVRAAGLEDKIRYLKSGEIYTFHPKSQ